MEKVIRNYLQIKSIDQLKDIKKPIGNFYIIEDKKKDFQLNKFFYKQIGKNHHWMDRQTNVERQKLVRLFKFF